MNKWNEGDNALRALVEWKHSRFSSVGQIFTGSRERLMKQCADEVRVVARVWLEAWGEHLKAFDHGYFTSRFRTLGIAHFPHSQAVIDYLMYRMELVCQDCKELCKPIRTQLRSEIRSVFFSAMIVDAPWNIKDMVNLHRLTCIWKSTCHNFLFLSKSLTCETHFRSELERQTRGMQMTIYRAPVIKAITFIQCIQPRCVNNTALADALGGVFERIFLDAMLGEKSTVQQQQTYPDILEIFYGEYGEEDDPDYYYEELGDDDLHPDVDDHQHPNADDHQHPNAVVRYGDEIPEGW